MNSNTFAGYYGGTGVNQIASQTLATATETEFKLNVATGTAPIAVLKFPQVGTIFGSTSPLNIAANSSKLVAAPFAGSPAFNTSDVDNGHPFLLRLAGVATPASNAGNTLGIKIYLGTSKSGTAICAPTAAAQDASTAKVHFLVEAELQWDSASQVLDGLFWYNIGGTTPEAAGPAALSANGASVTAALLQFCASTTWGNAAGGVASVSEFSLTQL